MRILQINTNRSRPAQYLTIATAKNIGAEILLVSEPNRNAICNRKNFVQDANLDTAIKILSTNIKIKNQGCGPGFAYIESEEFTIYSCYSSGNDEIDELLTTLTEIGNIIRFKNQEAIVAGDFNAKSPKWGMNITDRRGYVMTEWTAANNLVIANQGMTPTFKRQGYTSILDLTIVTENLKPRVTKWEVMEAESLSDKKTKL